MTTVWVRGKRTSSYVAEDEALGGPEVRPETSGYTAAERRGEARNWTDAAIV